MNTTNQTFSWKRFAATLRKELTENGRTILIIVLGTYLLLSFLMIYHNVNSSLDGNLVSHLKNYLPQKYGYLALVASTIVSTSLAFRNLTSKKGRVSLLTTPSSNLEKFLANVIIYIIGGFVMIHVCLQLADFTRIALLKPFQSDKIVVPGALNFLNLTNDTVTGTGSVLVKGMTLVLGFNLLACPAMYLLGSIMWPRLSMLKTFVVNQIFVIVLIAIYSYLFPNSDIDVVEWSFIGLAALQLILFFVFIGLAWNLFKRKDVVSRKWWK